LPLTDFLATWRESLASQVALNRPGTAEEVAKVSLLLAPDRASYTTGTSVEIGVNRTKNETSEYRETLACQGTTVEKSRVYVNFI
jgi:hypothetical protein